MSGPVRRDSQARCASPSHLYDAIRRPLRPPVLNQPSIDRMENPSEAPQESVQERLNRQMLEKMRNLGLNLPNDTLINAVQVGKYIVLAVMLPPYLVVYGIPRWLMVTAFPHVAGFLKAHGHRIGQFIQEWSNRILDLMKGALEQTLGQALNLMKNAARQFLNAALEAWLKSMNQLQGMIKKSIQTITDPFRAIAQQLNRAYSALQGMMNNVGKGLAELAKGIREIPSEAMQWMRSQIGRIAQAYQRITNRMSDAGQAVANFVSQLNAALANLTKPVFSGLEALREWSRNLGEKLFSGPAEMLEKIERLRKKVKEKVEDLGEKISKAYDRIKDKVENTVQQMGETVMHTLHATPQAILQAALWLYGLIPERRRGQFESFGRGMKRFGGRMKRLFAGAKNGIKICGSFVTEAYQKMKTEISNWMAFLKRMIVRLFRALLALPGKIWNLLKKIAPMILRGMKGLIYALRTFCAFLWALCVWGCSSTWELLTQYRLK